MRVGGRAALGEEGCLGPCAAGEEAVAAASLLLLPSGECFAAGERALGSPTTCLLLTLYIRFYRLAAGTGHKALCPVSRNAPRFAFSEFTAECTLLAASATEDDGTDCCHRGVTTYSQTIPHTPRITVSRCPH